jgi:rhodanese-related sulfurtransferase
MKAIAMETINAYQLQSMIDRNEDFFLINTLDEEHFPKTKIAGAVNIPQSQPDFAERVLQEVGDKQKTIVVYCAGQMCDSATQAAHKLQAAGFSQVLDFEAGAQGWLDAGHPVGDPMVAAPH